MMGGTICMEGYRARWSPATWQDPGEWYYDSRVDPICACCGGEGCDVVEARLEFEEEAADSLYDYDNVVTLTLEEIEALHGR